MAPAGLTLSALRRLRRQARITRVYNRLVYLPGVRAGSSLVGKYVMITVCSPVGLRITEYMFLKNCIVL